MDGTHYSLLDVLGFRFTNIQNVMCGNFPKYLLGHILLAKDFDGNNLAKDYDWDKLLS